MKMGATESVNTLKEKMRKSKENNSEEHSNSECRYIILYGCRINDTHFRNVTILLRICHCSNYNDCFGMANQRTFTLQEVLRDGVEIHVSNECIYKQTVREGLIWTSYRLEKQCCCPSEMLSSQRWQKVPSKVFVALFILNVQCLWQIFFTVTIEFRVFSLFFYTLRDVVYNVCSF